MRRLISENTKKRILVNEITNLALNLLKEDKVNNKQDEYIKKNGNKETNESRGKFISILKNDAVNLAALADEMNRVDPNGSWDSSRLVKVRDNKPGYTSGHFHVDKHMADVGLRAASNLGLI